MATKQNIQNIIKTLNKKELITLIFVANNPNTTAKKLSYLLEIPSSHVYKYLNILIKKDLVKDIQHGGVKKYVSEVLLNEL